MKETFLAELKKLLQEHNVTIGFDVSPCSDTHGLYDEKIVITKHEGFNEKTWLEVSGWGIDASDILGDNHER